jgi:methionine-rich copper-binding protein CopC
MAGSSHGGDADQGGRLAVHMEVSEYLVGSPAFKAGGTGDPRTAGSIPVHLRHLRQVFVGLALIVTAFVTVLGMPAGATARLLSSVPSDGASVEALETVEFEFDTLLLQSGASIMVTKLDGTRVELGQAEVVGTTVFADVIQPPVVGNYEVAYVVQSADGARNVGSIRVEVDDPGQEFSGGLIAVVVVIVALVVVVFVAARADRRRRPRKNRATLARNIPAE